MNYCLTNSNTSIYTQPSLRKNISACTNILMGGIVAGVISILTAQSAQAITFTESVDTGQALNSAQNVGNMVDRIDGTITTGDVDLYQFSLGSNTTFNASTEGLAGGNDTELFLFDATGAGIIANDDSGAGSESTINTSLTAGTYYLGIGLSQTRAVDGDGSFWDTNNPPSNFDTLDTFTTSSFLFFDVDYSIALSPATSSASVPFEFSPSLGLLLVGAGFGMKCRLKQTNRKKVSLN